MTFRDSREANVGEVIRRYEDSLSTDELDQRAEERFNSRPEPNSGAAMRLRLAGGALVATLVLAPAAVIGSRAIFGGSAEASGQSCIGNQTLTVPEGGKGPVDLVEENVAGNADPKSVPITVNVTGMGQTLAGNAPFTLPEGATVNTPATCVK